MYVVNNWIISHLYCCFWNITICIWVDARYEALTTAGMHIQVYQRKLV